MVTKELLHGWCRAHITRHEGCVKQFTLDGVTYTCDCECHNKEEN